jgi:hypothetical protein
MARRQNFKNKSTNITKPKILNRDMSISLKQSLFVYLEDCDEVLYGGAAGGGKSWAIMLDLLIYANKYPGSKQLLLRETFPELERSSLLLAYQIFPSEFCSYNQTTHCWYFFNGTVEKPTIVEFGYLESDADCQKYQSAEYDRIIFDEMSHFNEYRITYMKSRIRGANNFPKQLKGGTNPGGIGHKFLKKRFGIGTEDPYKIKKYYVGVDRDGNPRYETRCFIPATVYDNDFLLEKDPDYINKLLQLPEKEREALLNGNWNLYDDQAFPEWNYDIHTCEDFPIPKHWKRWRSCDNGYDDPFAWYWFAVNEFGTVFVYREYTRYVLEDGTWVKDKNLIPYSTQAEKVIEKSSHYDLESNKDIEDRFAFTVVGWEAFSQHKAMGDGKSLIDHYNLGGLYGCIEGIKDRRFRKSTFHEYLKPYEDKNLPEGRQWTAKIKFFRTCKVVIEKMPEMLKDPLDPEKVLDRDDHVFDSVGYGICAYHANKSKALEADKTPVQKHKERLARQNKRRIA